MPPRRMVETTSWGITFMSRGWAAQPTRHAPGRPGAWRESAKRNGPLLPLVPGAEGNPLGAIGRELFRLHGDELAALPLQHVVLHPGIRVLTRLVELHSPAVQGGANGQVHGQHGGPELVEVVGLRRVEHELQQPEAAARELMPARDVRTRLGLHGVAIGALDPLSVGLHAVDDEARTRLEQGEGSVAIVAEGLAEVGRAVPGGT